MFPILLNYSLSKNFSAISTRKSVILRSFLLNTYYILYSWLGCSRESQEYSQMYGFFFLIFVFILFWTDIQNIHLITFMNILKEYFCNFFKEVCNFKEFFGYILDIWISITSGHGRFINILNPEKKNLKNFDLLLLLIKNIHQIIALCFLNEQIISGIVLPSA